MKKNNKGFSLVELIVVIAVMAVLVVVLAPAYLRYVDKARLQKDISAISEVIEAIKVSAAEEEVVNEILTDTSVAGLKTSTYAEVKISKDDGVISASTVSGIGDHENFTNSVPAPNLLREVTATVGEEISLSRKEFEEIDVKLTVIKSDTYNVYVTVNTYDFRLYEDVYEALSALGDTPMSSNDVQESVRWMDDGLCANCGGSFVRYGEGTETTYKKMYQTGSWLGIPTYGWKDQAAIEYNLKCSTCQKDKTYPPYTERVDK